jgi:transcription-repair coupling factor (superfamily II helicase)
MNVKDLIEGNFYVYEVRGICKYVKPEYINGDLYYLFYFKNKRKCYARTVDVETKYYFYASSDKKVTLSCFDNKKSWQKKRDKTIEEIQNTAKELIKLYTERQTLEGYAFDKDTDEQIIFENSYEYELTLGQKSALTQVKQDLELNKPANILLYGSVGCGKSTIMQCITFKAYQSGYQTVVLAPTELLAKQHFLEYMEIFKPYKNVNIVFISSGISKKKKELIKQQIESGESQIIIGTTSILSQNYNFYKLGLILIDEEQKYSSKQKELLKLVDPKINTILITGTSIPRTTYMAMSGILHKISIDSLPENKKEPSIELSKHKDETIVKYIKRELGRNGQIYYILNDTLGLYRIREYLLKLNNKYHIKDDLKIGIVNGKLKKKESDQIFSEFKNGDYDILIATSIVEIGLTCGNANTVLIDECDRFGLSSLTQLIGRVGRSGIKPYVLLMYEGELNPVSKKRLDTILTHTELNNAEAIAREDLNIRGKGQLFSGKQHGHLVQIGMDMYNNLLEKELQKQKKEIS